ncbi:MAG: hypothetical protein RLZZ56_1184, partial [Actinomycetota bacterium]
KENGGTGFYRNLGPLFLGNASFGNYGVDHGQRLAENLSGCVVSINK